MAASWKELLTLIITILLLITISSSHDTIETQQKAGIVEVDETELGDEVVTDTGVHPPVEDAEVHAAEQEPGERQATREPEAADETEIGPEADETECDGSKVEERSDEVSSETSSAAKTEVVEEGIASSSEAQPPLEAVRVDNVQQQGVPSESLVQVPVATDVPQHEAVPPVVQPDSKSPGEERQDSGLAAEVRTESTGKPVVEADPTETDDDETEGTESISVDQSEGEQLEATTSVGEQSRDVDATEVSKQSEKSVETVESRTGAEGTDRLLETPVEGKRDDSQQSREPSVSSEKKEKEAGEKPVGVVMQEQRQEPVESQLKEAEHRPTLFGSRSEDVDRKVRLPEKSETGVEQEKMIEASGTGDAEAKEKSREDVENVSVVAQADAGGIRADSETLDAANESAADQAIPRDATQEELKHVKDDAVKDDTGAQTKPLGHDAAGASGDTRASEDEKVEHYSQPLNDRLADSVKDPMYREEDQKRDHAKIDSDLKFTDKLSAQDHPESDIPGHDRGARNEKTGSHHQFGNGLRSLLSEKVLVDEYASKTLDEQPLSEQSEWPGEQLERPFTDDVDKEHTESPSYEEEKEFETDKSSEDFPTDDNSSFVSRFLTLRPYVILSEHAFSVLDPWLEQIVRSFPPEMQKLFLKAPFALTPSRALLLFIASCISLLIVSSCAWRQSCRQKSRQFEKQSILEQLSTVQGALLISEKEKEAADKELESLKEQLAAYEDRSTLSSDEAGQLSSQVESLTSERDTLQQKVAQQLDQISDLSATVSSQLQSSSSATGKSKSMQKKLEETTAHASMLESQLYELQTTLQQSQSSALEMQSQLQSMTEEIAILQTSKDQLLLEAEGWNEKVQEQADQISRLRDEEKTHQEAISLKDKEISVLRECYQQLKLFESGLESANTTNEDGDGEDEDDEERKKRVKDEVQKKIKGMIDVAQVNAKLNAAEEEKNSLKHTLSMEMESRMELEDQVKVMKAEMEKVMESRQEAEQQATRTALKMDVLVNYFKEKETEMNRKLGEQEAREKASVDQLVNTDERTKEFENMVHLYKEQVEDLQKEIHNIEADYRKQIALQEKKAHENWLVARQSEREVKEYKTESQMQRHKILDLQNKLEAATAEIKTGQEMVQTAPGGIGLANGMPLGDDRPTSRPLLQPPFGPPPFVPGPFPPLDRPLPPPLFGPPMPPLPPMMFDRRGQELRSPPPFDMWPPPSHMRRSPMPPRDRSPPRNRSPSPPSQRGRMSPTSLRGGRYSPPHGGRSPPSVIGDRQSPRFSGPRGGPPHGGNPRPARPSYNRSGTDQRPGPRLPPHLQRSDFHVSSGPRSSTPDC